jgi:hypothetical protein
MNLIITLLSILMLCSATWGITCLFRKGHRLRGLAYIFIAPLILIIAITYFSLLEQDRKAQEAGYTNFAAQEVAELDALARSEGFKDHDDKLKFQKRNKALALEKEQAAQAEALREKLGGFPDEETLQAAANAGIDRFEAYRLLNNDTVISKYCSYSAKSNQIAETKLAELDQATDESVKTKIWEKYEIIQDKRLSTFNYEIGLKDLEYLTLANAGFWNWHCRAAEENWDVFTPAQAARITYDNARLAKENLEDFYITNLYEIKMPFIVNDKSLSVACSVKDLKDRHYLGCYFTASGGKISQHIIYTLGKSDDGRLLLSPLNGKASGHAKGLGVKQGSRTYLQGQLSGKVYLARIADSEDISAVLDLF